MSHVFLFVFCLFVWVFLQPMSESDLVDEFSKDFACPAQPAVQPKAPKLSNTAKVSLSGSLEEDDTNSFAKTG